MRQYRVWQMETVTETEPDYYRELIVQVIGTPFGVQDTVLNEQQFDDLRAGLNSMSSGKRPVFFYQELEKNPNASITELIEKGKEKREEYAKRLERAKADEAKRKAQAEKRKKERERKKYEKLKAQFDGDK